MDSFLRNKKIPRRGSCKGWYVEKIQTKISNVTTMEAVTE